MIDKNKFDKLVAFDRKFSTVHSALYDVGINLDVISDNLIPELIEELFWAYFPEAKDKTWDWHINGNTIKMNLYDWYSEYHSWAKADNFDNPDYKWIYEQLATLADSQ